MWSSEPFNPLPVAEAAPPPPPLTLKDGLISFWAMEEASGNRLDSVTANHNDLPPFGSPLPGNATGVPVGGNGVALVATNSDYLEIDYANTTNLNTNTDFSLSMWVKPTSTVVSGMGLICYMNGVPNSNYLILFGSTGPNVQFRIFDASSSHDLLSTLNTFNVGSWYHIVCMYERSTTIMTITINDQVTPDTVNSGLTTVATTSGIIQFGNFTQKFDGVIDQVGFWHRLLTADEITQLYNSGRGLLYSQMDSTTTTWNPSDKGAGLSLSADKLVATSSVGGYRAVRSVASANSGKKYWELVVTATSVNSITVGFGNASAPLTAYIGSDNNSFGWQAINDLIRNATTVAHETTWTNGDVLCMALDITNKLFWVRTNGGNWNNNAANDPAAGTGGFDFSALAAGPYFAMGCTLDSGDTCTARFGPSPNAPAGFGTW